MDSIEEISDFIDEGLVEINSINLEPSLLDDNNHTDFENNCK